MPIWIDPDETKRHVLTTDAHLGEDAPWFELGVPLTREQDELAEVMLSMQDDVALDAAVKTANDPELESEAKERRLNNIKVPWRAISKTLRASLRGWGNWTKPNGEPVEFRTDASGRPTDWTLSQLPALARLELFGVAFELVHLTGTERD